MNRLPMNQHDDFDRSLRQLQQHAEGALPPATLLRLRQARQHASAAAQAPRRHAAGWVLATAFSAVLAVTIGLQFNRTPSAPQPASPATAATDETSDDTLLFDENPELYLWLGSDALAME